MRFTQLAIVRILESADRLAVVDAILSSEPYQQDILQASRDLVTAIENILFDQVGEVPGFGEQFKLLFGQNIRSLIAYISGNPLAAGSEYPEESISLFEEFFNFVKDLFDSEPTETDCSECEAKLETCDRNLRIANRDLAKAKNGTQDYEQLYYKAWKEGRSSPTGNFYQRVYNIIHNMRRDSGLL